VLFVFFVLLILVVIVRTIILLRPRLRPVMVVSRLLERAVWRRRGALLRLRVLSLRRRVEPPVLLRRCLPFLRRCRPILRRRIVAPVLLWRSLPLLGRRRIATWLFLPEVRAPLV